MGPRRPSWERPERTSSWSLKPRPRRKRVRWSQLGRAVADAEVLGGGLVEAALGEELAGDLGLGAIQLLDVELRRGLVGLHQAGALALLAAGV